MAGETNRERRQLLAEIIERRDLLNAGIASITYDLEHPRPPIKIDFKEIKRECEEFLQFLYKCVDCGVSLTKDERQRFNNLVEIECHCDKCKGV